MMQVLRFPSNKQNRDIHNMITVLLYISKDLHIVIILVSIPATLMHHISLVIGLCKMGVPNV